MDVINNARIDSQIDFIKISVVNASQIDFINLQIVVLLFPFFFLNSLAGCQQAS
jgi:hypothetical protein